MADRHILIVDDETSIRESLAEYLLDFGMVVDTAKNAEEALEFLRSQPVEAMLVDLRLPGLSGELLILQAFKLSPQIRFLIHTGSVDYSLSPELIAIGLTPDQIILKPQLELSLLVRKIEALFKD